MRLGGIVLNRVVMSAENCSRCRARLLQGKKAVQFLKQKFPRVPRLIGIDPGNPLLGARQLQRFGKRGLCWRTRQPRRPAAESGQS